MAKKRDRKKTKKAQTAEPSPAWTEMDPGWAARLGKLVFPGLLLGLQLGLLSGWNVYQGNRTEFDHGLLDLMPIFLPASLVLFALFWFGPSALTKRAHARTVAIMTMLGVLLYVQGNFLIWDYGVFDGGELRTDPHRGKGWLELALWSAALAWAAFRPRMLYRVSRAICLGLILIQGGSLLAASLGAEEGYWHRAGSFDDMPAAEIYEYSGETNVIHIVMDAFQTDVFEEVLEEEGLVDALDGFVLYRDNLGVAAHTAFAIPAVFSGEIFDGTETPDSYYGRSIDEAGFQNVLFDEGYRVNLLPRLRMDQSRFNHHFRVPDVFGGSRGFRQRQAAGQLLDVGLFRQVPHVAKAWVHNEGQWRVSGLISTPPVHRSFHQRAFLGDYISKIDPVLEEPTYNFIHIMSPHPPYGVRADGSPSPEPMPLTRESYKHEARYCLRTFIDLLARLRDLGIHDEAFIILQGDHGSDFPPVIDGRAVDLPVDRASTLLAVKVPGATGSLKVSRAPSTIADIPATVVHVLGLTKEFPGVPLTELPEGAQRTRGFFQYLGGDRGTPVLRRFQVEGPVFDPGNWTTREDLALEQEVAAYAWGEVLEFGMEGNAGTFTGPGWAAPLSHGQWSDGDRATLRFSCETPDDDVVFLIAMRPFLVPGKLDRQRVRILVNDTELTTLTLADPDPKLYKLTIPAAMIDAPEARITFDLPDATVPKELGVAGDERQLGISMISVCLFPESMAEEIIERTAASGPTKSGR